MKKVILLSGSPNLNGNTMLTLKECSKAIENQNVETEIISLSGIDLSDCMNFERQKTDGFNDIIEKIKNAQGLIVAGPVYWGTVRAEVMTALQRISMASMKNGNFLSRKVGGPIAVARRGGLTSSISEMMMFFLANDMIVPGSTYWNMVLGQKPGDVLEDKEGIGVIRRFGENVAYLINKLD